MACRDVAPACAFGVELRAEQDRGRFRLSAFASPLIAHTARGLGGRLAWGRVELFMPHVNKSTRPLSIHVTIHDRCAQPAGE